MVVRTNVAVKAFTEFPERFFFDQFSVRTVGGKEDIYVDLGPLFGGRAFRHQKRRQAEEPQKGRTGNPPAPPNPSLPVLEHAPTHISLSKKVCGICNATGCLPPPRSPQPSGPSGCRCRWEREIGMCGKRSQPCDNRVAAALSGRYPGCRPGPGDCLRRRQM